MRRTLLSAAFDFGVEIDPRPPRAASIRITEKAVPDAKAAFLRDEPFAFRFARGTG